jgi:hypothetical protein
MQNRRHFLQSSTALIALPFLESLGFRRFASAASPVAPPKRLMFLSFGWGVTESTWYPDITKPGRDYELPPGLKPLERHKADFSVVQGLWNKHSQDGHGGSTFWLTGADRYAQPGQSFCNSISADQVAAAQMGLETRYASLQFNGTSMNAALTGHGPGLSLAWNLSGKPVAGFNGPMAAYHALFSKNTTPIEQQKALLEQKRSVLDAVLDNAHALQRGLSRNDNSKLEEYFQGIREIELRLAKEEQWIGVPQPESPLGAPKPEFNGKEEVILLYDLMVAAMQTDSTRVLTFRQPVDTLLKAWDIKVHPHDMSHYHTTLGEKLVASQKRDAGLSELLALFLDKLKAVKEADGSRLFDHCALAYGSNLRTGHDLTNCPTILSGGGAGLKPGEHIVVTKNTPLCNAWLSMLHGVGVKAERHGDSTGPLREILA